MTIANNIATFVEDTIADMAHDQVSMWENGEPNETFSEMEADGIIDIAGAYADHLYNDPEVLADIMGDRVFYSAGWDSPSTYEPLLDELSKVRTFPAWIKACDLLRR
jgi:hypothetical protein